MFGVPGYELGAHTQRPDHLLYRASHRTTGLPAIIKIAAEGTSLPDELARLSRDCEITAGLDRRFVARGLQVYAINQRACLVREASGSMDLRELLERGRISIGRVLKLAVGIAGALGSIHSARVLHRNLRPDSVRVEPESGHAWLCDFDIATYVTPLNPQVSPGRLLRGALPYVSPEQTGRVNRLVDQRADFYSFGVLLFELLTGSLPFSGSESLELIHAHIARRPPDPRELRESIPPILAELVLRLLAKNPSNRYETAQSLERDLKRIHQDFSANRGQAPSFTLADRDISNVFRFSPKLYGRESEIQVVSAAVDSAASGSCEVLLVSGPAGIGKTSIIRQARVPTMARRGYFISGKYDQFARAVPYRGLLEAFGELVKQILTEPDAEVAAWRERIQAALGENAAVIAQVVAGLDHIMVDMPTPAEIGSAESEHRFNDALLKFMSCLSSSGRPLALFLDDMQWAGEATLAFLETALSESPSLCLIMAWRAEEVDATHPLTASLKRLRGLSISMRELELESVDVTALTALCSDSLSQPPEAVGALAETVFTKTGGNPFFVRRFMVEMVSQGLITFEPSAQRWSWDQAMILDMPSTANVAEVLASRLSSLPPEVSESLKIAACVGNRFDLPLIASLQSADPLDLAESMAIALDAGLVVSAFDLPVNMPRDLELDDEALKQLLPECRFTHDRIQQAAYALFDGDPPLELRLTLGRQLRERMVASTTTSDELLFETVGHFNAALSELVEPAERLSVADLNLQAGRTAARALAFKPALKFLEAARSLMPPNAWESRPAITRELMTLTASTALRVGDVDGMNRAAEEVIRHADGVLETIDVRITQLEYFTASQQQAEAVEQASTMLADLGHSANGTAGQGAVALALLRTMLLMRGRTIEQIYNAPTMTDPAALATLRVISASSPQFFVQNPNTMVLLALAAVRLSLRYGNTSRAVWGYVLYGIVLCAMGRIDAGYEMGLLGLRMLEQYPSALVRAEVSASFKSSIEQWKRPHRDCAVEIHREYELARAAGARNYAAINLYMTYLYRFFAGFDLSELARELPDVIKLMESWGEAMYRDEGRAILAAVERLNGSVSGPVGIPPYEGGGDFAAYEDTQPDIVRILIEQLRAMVAYLFGEQDVAEAAIEAAAKREPAAGPTLFLPEGSFWYALIKLRRPGTSGKKQALKRIKRYRKWRRHCMANFAPKLMLLEAELARVEGRHGDAIKAYAEGRRLAEVFELSHLVALADELMGRFYMAAGDNGLGERFLEDAVRSYLKWGASGKAAALESELGRTVRAVERTASFEAVDHLDQTSVLAAARALSGEVRLEPLLRQLMRLALQTGGAQAGALLVPRDGQLWAEARAAGVDDVVLETVLLRQCPDVVSAVVNLARRTGEPVVIDDAQVGRFSHDRGVVERGVRSIACAPLVARGELTALLYLENNLAPGVFTEERLQPLSVLTAQAAVSIRNAQLFAQQLMLTKAYQRFVPQAFLAQLGQRSIVDVELGMQVEREMTVLFSDIRSFTTLSEQMSPAEVFNFVNDYLKRMGPIIRAHNGFIDKYIGDAIMALFPEGPADALDASRDMFAELKALNAEREAAGKKTFAIGMGIHSGQLMLGTVGEEERMEGTVMSDAVNIASRLEGSCRSYGVSIVISEAAAQQVGTNRELGARPLGAIPLKGKASGVPILEVLRGTHRPDEAERLASAEDFEVALKNMEGQRYQEALRGFRAILDINPDDVPASIFATRCERALEA